MKRMTSFLPSISRGLCLWAFAGISAAMAQTDSTMARNTLFLDVTRTITSWVGAELPLVGFDFERQISPRGWSLLGTVRFGYTEDGPDVDWGWAGGMGFRKYLYRPFSGTFLQLYGDVGEGHSKTEYESSRTRFAYGTLEFGYKMQWDDFMLSLHSGPAYFGFSNSKRVTLTGGIDVGFPFSAKTFNLP